MADLKSDKKNNNIDLKGIAASALFSFCATLAYRSVTDLIDNTNQLKEQQSIEQTNDNVEEIKVEYVEELTAEE